MISLAQLVDDSLLRHGVETNLDAQRLHWTEWFLVESSFSFLRVPDRSGIFALAEEVIAPGEAGGTEGKRMLAIYRVSEAEHLGLTMGRLFLPGGAEGHRLHSGRCFARYAVIEDDQQRKEVLAALQRWMASSANTVLGVTAPPDASPAARSSNKEEAQSAQIGLPTPLPAGF